MIVAEERDIGGRDLSDQSFAASHIEVTRQVGKVLTAEGA